MYSCFLLQQGFGRAFDAMDDIVLDNPHAYRTLAAFVDKCARTRVISLSLRDKAPSRYLVFLFNVCFMLTNKGRFCNTNEIGPLISERLSVENKAKLSRLTREDFETLAKLIH